MLLELILGFCLGVFISLSILIGIVCLLKYCGDLDSAEELERTLMTTIKMFIIPMIVIFFVIFII